ncbi:MAG TPA: glycosyltransferase family 2 protein [Gemmatimonadaceae bacterium]|jgi:cellulose synthase/poly-beta-1,6-N-acetylglucosamine synthase-like glycosyltransferase|nr:glycosyltransferase family 2 protein [Gemmatimonadaceae bacterium]
MTTSLPPKRTRVAAAPRTPPGNQATHAAGESKRVAPLTVIVPAYNEAESIADTIRSLQAQTVRPEEIVVVDDCSSDDTAEIARAMGVTVIRPPVNTGSKAGAQDFALTGVKTRFTMAIDADTTLAPNAIEKLLPALDAPGVAAACGFVIPRSVKTLWERGRYIEYLFAFTFYKQVQEYYEKPLISSGCFSVYRTDALVAHNGWETRTLAEDMDLTWSFYEAGEKVRFVPDAVCYPIEPHTYRFMSVQLKRWSHGFVQNVRLHWRSVLHVPYLRSAVAVSLWDASLAAFLYLLLLPVLAIYFRMPWMLLGYVIDAPAMLVPVMAGAIPRGEGFKALMSLPAFFVLRTVNAVFFLRALFSEVFGRGFHKYEKGH